MRRRTLHLAACAACVTALGVAIEAAEAEQPPGRTHELLPHQWSIRFAGGIAQPLGDLANDEPRDGWVGGQSLGYALHAGLRIPLMRELFVRPELSFYGFGEYRDTDVPTLIFDGSGADPDTVSGDWTRETLMSGLRVHLDYLPADRGLVSPFLTGGLGLVYMRVDDEIILAGETVEQEDDALGLSATAGVGLLIGNAELLFEGTFQEPGFTDVGAVSWFTVDVSLGLALPLPR